MNAKIARDCFNSILIVFKLENGAQHNRTLKRKSLI